MTNKEYREALKKTSQPNRQATKPATKSNSIKVAKKIKTIQHESLIWPKMELFPSITKPEPSTITSAKIGFANERLKNIKK